MRSTARDEYLEWRHSKEESGEMSYIHLGKVNEVQFTDFLISAIVRRDHVAQIVLDALLGSIDDPRIRVQNITAVLSPSSGPDILIIFKDSDGERFGVVVEHKRGAPSHAVQPPKDWDLDRFPTNVETLSGFPAIWQIDACYHSRYWVPDTIAEGLNIFKWVFFDQKGRSVDAAYSFHDAPETVSYTSENWEARSYSDFGDEIMSAFDGGDSSVKTALTPIVIALWND